MVLQIKVLPGTDFICHFKAGRKAHQQPNKLYYEQRQEQVLGEENA